MNSENEFELNGKRYIAASRRRCSGCAFFDEDFNCDMIPSCESERRSDGRNVIFVEAPNPEQKPKPKTNGDWLRSLNNEELAAELHELATSAIAHTVKDLVGKFELPEDVRASDRRKLKEWLDSPLTKGDSK